MTVVDDAVTRLRAEWATRFTEAVAVTRVGNRGTFNATTLQYDTPLDVDVFTGLGLFRPASVQESQELFGEETVSVVAMHVYLPYDTVVGLAGILVGDQVVKTAPPANGDLSLIGKPMTVEAWQFDSYKTRLELVCRMNLGGSTYGDSG